MHSPQRVSPDDTLPEPLRFVEPPRDTLPCPPPVVSYPPTVFPKSSLIPPSIPVVIDLASEDLDDDS